MDTKTKPRRSVGRKLRHRAAQLRKMAGELDAIAGEIETGGAVPRVVGDQEAAVEGFFSFCHLECHPEMISI